MKVFINIVGVLMISLLPATWSRAQTVPATPALDPKTGIVVSSRLASGVPLGGVGAGTFQLLTDGTISHAAYQNNEAFPTGDLPGCFAALWTRTGSQSTARVLALKSGYTLPGISALHYDGLFPIARLTYPDASLPLTVTMQAFSPLIPHDLRNSSFPGAVFLFRLKNRTATPVDFSLALAWEDTLGVGGNGITGPFSNRTGNLVAPLPGADGYFGMKFTGPPLMPVTASFTDRMRDNATGEMTLLTLPPRGAAQVTTAGWNALEARPSWWQEFGQEGKVSGKTPVGEEGRVHPAGVVAVRLTLGPGDQIAVPFAVAWHTPVRRTLSGRDEGRYYQTLFPDSMSAARGLLNEWRSLLELTAEWQKRLLFSNLPVWLSRRLINSIAVLSTHAVRERDGGIAFRREAGTNKQEALPNPLSGELNRLTDGEILSGPLMAFFPRLQARTLLQFTEANALLGRLPRSLGNTDRETPESLSESVSRLTERERISEYGLQTERYVAATGDLSVLQEIFPTIQANLESHLTKSEEGSLAPAPSGKAPSASATGKTIVPPVGSSEKWREALLAGARLASLAAEESLKIGGADEETRAALDVPTTLLLAATESERRTRLAERWEKMAQALPEVPHKADTVTAQESGEAEQLIRAGKPLEGVTLLERRENVRNNLLRSPWQTPPGLLNAKPDDAIVPGDLLAIEDWNALQALQGLEIDLNQNHMTLLPQIPGTWRRLQTPVFAPTFWGRLDYRPLAHGSLLTLRIDRIIPVAPGSVRSRLRVGASLIVRTLRVPGPPARPDNTTGVLSASVSQRAAALGLHLVREPSGTVLITLDAPLTLTAGDRLEIDVHD